MPTGYKRTQLEMFRAKTLSFIPKLQDELAELVNKKIQIEQQIKEITDILKSHGVVTTTVLPAANNIGGASYLKKQNEPECPNPLSDEAITIGKALPEEFCAEDIRKAVSTISYPNSYAWIARWKNKGWIETIGLGRSKRTSTFGVR